MSPIFLPRLFVLRLIPVFFCLIFLNSCANNLNKSTNSAKANESAIYEIAVAPNVSYQDVVDSLKTVSEGKNFVNPANFPIAENMKKRGQNSVGVLETHALCNLSLGADIMIDHPEFVVFAPCRIGLYEKRDVDNKLQLYLGLDRPTYDLKSIKNPTERAKKAAQELEDTLIEIMKKASKGDI